MRTFELRVYKLRTKREEVYPRHLNSFPLFGPLFGIEAHGFWAAMADVQPRLFALVSYVADEEPGKEETLTYS